ncbi:MAG TPA: RNA polymerase sigma factor [Terriglobales bacterium]|jgi:RNA polymerase sigma-70 factor (ECF subfamily)|nr:RNA polymerase sigma factor [Terriglobales bacterium]
MGGFERYMPGPMVFELTEREPDCMADNAVAPEIEALVREHSRLVFRIAYSVVRNHADAEDVVQEVFLRVAKHGTAGIADTKAWISRIAWRASVDRYRQFDRRNQEEFDERVHASHTRLSGTEQETISREMLALLDRMIAVLPKKERDALLLTSVEEMSSAEAATVLGTTETSIRARVFRARQKLAEKLQKVAGTKYGR